MRGCAVTIGCILILFGCIGSIIANVFDSTSVVWGFVQIGTGVLIVKANIGKHDSRIREYIEINVPEDINSYLVEGEIIDREFDLEDGTVFTSINRMFIEKG
ncbi:MAG: hypothetical protein ISS55_10730, partial [Dehalococcoidales bacterium]|nr:hypothetical protein [Dehalococcoidales bacterium]